MFEIAVFILPETGDRGPTYGYNGRMNVAQILCAGSFAGAEAVACSLTRALQPEANRSILYLVQEVRVGRESCARLVERAQPARG